jgi:Mg-chelatase subunit ChlD
VRRLGAALACALVAVVAVGSTASAASAPTVAVKSVDTSHFPTVTVTYTDSAGQPSSLTVMENGQLADNVQRQGTGGTAVALAIDTSASMAGKPIKDAIAAAQTFVFGQSKGTQLGVYGFGDKSYLAADFADNPNSASTALGQLGTTKVIGTALYSAVVQASNALGKQPASRRALVLLTDGSSYKETATLAQAIAAAKAAHVTIYAVATSSHSAIGPLNQMTHATGGITVPAADSSGLKAAYAKIAATVGSVSTFKYHSLVPAGDKITLSVTADNSAPALYTSKAPGTPAGSKPSSSGAINLPTTAAGRAAIAGVTALFVLLAAIVLLSSRPAVMVGKRIMPFTEQRKQVVAAIGTDVPKISMLHQLYVATEKVAGSLN